MLESWDKNSRYLEHLFVEERVFALESEILTSNTTVWITWLLMRNLFDFICENYLGINVKITWL